MVLRCRESNTHKKPRRRQKAKTESDEEFSEDEEEQSEAEAESEEEVEAMQIEPMQSPGTYHQISQPAYQIQLLPRQRFNLAVERCLLPGLFNSKL